MTMVAVLILLVVGASLAVGGVFVLAGLGWSLLVGSAVAFGSAGILLRGLRSE